MGERLSAILLTHVLKAEGLNSKFITLDKLITKKFDASSLDQQFYDYIVSRLAQEVVPYVESHVCVITGFFGPCPGSLLSSVGRGYTDLTAALVAVAAQAKEYQIWKEVDGIFTADPRKVPDAKKLDYITPEEAAELTYYGSEVVHPFTMEQVIRANIPIRIKNTFNPAGTGTLITREVMSPQIGDDRSPTAVTIKDNVTVLNISSNRKSVSHGFLAKTFLVLDQFGIVVDLISTSEVHVSMALGVGLSAEVLEKAVLELEKTGRVDVVKNMAILSLVGKKMRNTVGISARMFSCLASHEVNLEMISQGASEINVSCVIKNSEALKAVNCVHHALILQKQ